MIFRGRLTAVDFSFDLIDFVLDFAGALPEFVLSESLVFCNDISSDVQKKNKNFISKKKNLKITHHHEMHQLFVVLVSLQWNQLYHLIHISLL